MYVYVYIYIYVYIERDIALVSLSYLTRYDLHGSRCPRSTAAGAGEGTAGCLGWLLQLASTRGQDKRCVFDKSTPQIPYMLPCVVPFV